MKLRKFFLSLSATLVGFLNPLNAKTPVFISNRGGLRPATKPGIYFLTPIQLEAYELFEKLDDDWQGIFYCSMTDLGVKL